MSLVGGLIIFIISTLNVLWFSSGATNFGGYGSFMRGAMDGYHNFMGTYGSSTSFLAGISVIGCNLRNHSCNWRHYASGTATSTCTVGYTYHSILTSVSFVGMGGYFIGAVLGIIGGAFELSVRRTNP